MKNQVIGHTPIQLQFAICNLQRVFIEPQQFPKQEVRNNNATL
jgi:hypothetical protein